LIPDLSEQVFDITEEWSNNPDLPLNQRGTIESFFDVKNGKSLGEKFYPDGDCPYISSGDSTNSIIRMVTSEENQVFNGGISVTAFGRAYVQPWSFIARGNGGSSVRVLMPKFNMSFKELLWFASQINAQQWRFSYARMTIKSRLVRLIVDSPQARITDVANISDRVALFKESLNRLSQF